MAEPTSGAEQTTDVVIPAVPSLAVKEESSPTDVVLKVLGAIGTGIGILGFVTLFGGALIWVRADKAELPATEAVSVVPRNVLVTTGATFLLPAALIAAGVIAVIFLVHLVFRLFEEHGVKPKRREAKTLRRTSSQTARTAVTEQQAWKLADAALRNAQGELEAAHKRQAPSDQIAELETKVGKRRVEAERLLEIAERSISASTTAKANADNLTEESEEKLERGWKQWAVELTLAALALAVAVPLVNGAICHVDDFLEWLALALVAVAGTAITLLVYWETQKFVWFGVVAFLAAGIYLAGGAYFSTHRNPKLQPVAALRPGHDPVVGNYIAATSESLYVGTFRGKGTAPRLIVVPRAQISEFVIGPPLETASARRRAITMALNECDKEIQVTEPEAPEAETAADQPGAAKPTEKVTNSQPSEYEKACTEPQIEALEASLNR
jgi:hypothetical protein